MLKPTAVLEINGAFKHNPKRRRPHEPQSGDIGEAPDRLDEDIRDIWDELINNCAPGVWQSSDRVFMEALATQVARMRRDPLDFGVKSLTLLMQMLSRAGMTPADRSRVVVGGKEADKPRVGLAAFR